MKPTCIVSCPIDTFSGYGHRSRDFVRSLIKVKGNEWDIKIAAQKWGNTPWGYLKEDDPLKQVGKFSTGKRRCNSGYRINCSSIKFYRGYE